MKQYLSVLPPCRLSGCFLGIGSFDFSGYLHGAKNPYEAVRDKVRFFGKTFFGPEIG